MIYIVSSPFPCPFYIFRFLGHYCNGRVCISCFELLVHSRFDNVVALTVLIRLYMSLGWCFMFYVSTILVQVGSWFWFTEFFTKFILSTFQFNSIQIITMIHFSHSQDDLYCFIALPLRFVSLFLSKDHAFYGIINKVLKPEI